MRKIGIWFIIIIMILPCTVSSPMKFVDSKNGAKSHMVSSTLVHEMWSFTLDGAWPYANPFLIDANGDGYTDIIVSGQEYVYAISGMNGSIIWKFHVVSHEVSGILGVGNVTPDAFYNILVPYPHNRIICLNSSTGSIIWDRQGNSLWDPYFVDLNDDGNLECVTNRGVLNPLNGDLVRTHNTPQGFLVEPVFTDISGDGKTDFIAFVKIAEGDYDLWAFRGSDGEILWKYTDIGTSYGNLYLADISGDDIPEIIGLWSSDLGGSSRSRGVHVLDATNGDLLFKKKLSLPGYASFGDVNGDGTLELIYSNEYLYVLSTTDFDEIWSSTYSYGDYDAYLEMSIADLNNDLKLDILAWKYVSDYCAIVAISNDNETELWRYWLTGDPKCGPILGDLNGDGDLEVIVATSEGTTKKLYALDIDDAGYRRFWPIAIDDSPYPATGCIADIDQDNDMIETSAELKIGTDENNNDTDGDLMPDGFEIAHDLNPFMNDSSLDLDNDSLTNYEEFQYSTDPRSNDSDLDKIGDFQEISVYGTNPARKDTDHDMLSDWDEINIYHTNPLLNDTNGDGISDYWEIEKQKREVSVDNIYGYYVPILFVAAVLIIIFPIFEIIGKPKTYSSKHQIENEEHIEQEGKRSES